MPQATQTIYRPDAESEEGIPREEQQRKADKDNGPKSLKESLGD